MKTPMQELINELESFGIPILKDEYELIDKYMEKEKQMIIDAWNDGFSMLSDLKDNQSAEQYYNETFKQYKNLF